ncbi:type II toxin-antitoxin system VapC family toxin [Nocardioides sp. CCNWLW239]|uniref:type II toxin-antitoxin system VapC family toxin n=1 Tax=Nocardioides sp. CCNWLW239 TaxID=3128902 RepID=UPI00301AF513
MIVDSSALIAVLRGEPDRKLYIEKLADGGRMSVTNWVEASIVAESRGAAADLDALVSEASIELVPVSIEQARAARSAYRRFGKGRGSPAQLNFGDCFAYALTITEDDALLFKGDDFTHTDVIPALPTPSMP